MQTANHSPTNKNTDQYISDRSSHNRGVIYHSLYGVFYNVLVVQAIYGADTWVPIYSGWSLFWIRIFFDCYRIYAGLWNFIHDSTFAHGEIMMLGAIWWLFFVFEAFAASSFRRLLI